MFLLLLMFVVVVAVLQAFLFIDTAIAVLPWTITATVVAGIVAVQLGKYLGSKLGNRVTIATVGTFALTIAFGFLGYWAISPVPPSPPKERDPLFWGMPATSQEDIRQMFPVHLFIWALGGAAVAGGWCYWGSRETCPNERRAIRPIRPDRHLEDKP